MLARVRYFDRAPGVKGKVTAFHETIKKVYYKSKDRLLNLSWPHWVWLKPRLKLAGISFVEETSGGETPPIEPIYDSNGITLRDFQKAAVDEILAVPFGVFDLAVNAGKTEVILFAAKAIIESSPHTRVVVLSHSAQLLWQNAERASRYFPKEMIAKLGDGNKPKDKDWRFLVGVDKSFINHIKDIPRPTHIFVDEVHLQTKTQLAALLQHPNMVKVARYGFSGTVWSNKDDLHNNLMLCTYGDVACNISTQTLVDQGISANAELVFLKTEVEKICTGRLTRNASDLQDILLFQSRTRNAKIVNLALNFVEDGKTVYIAVKRLEHLLTLRDAIEKHYPQVQRFHGNLKQAEREAVIQELRSGKCKIIIATTAFGTGVSVDTLDVLINASGGSSPMEVVQRFGRIIRNYKGKECPVYVDFLDIGHEFTERLAKARKLILEQELQKKSRIVNTWQEVFND